MTELWLALDVSGRLHAQMLAKKTRKHVDVFKIGLQLFTAEGPDIVEAIHLVGRKVFLDLKFHDIPNTVAHAVDAALCCGADYVSIHLMGGAEMVKEAVRMSYESVSANVIVGITVLTSQKKSPSDYDLSQSQYHRDQVANLAYMGCFNGIRNMVMSVEDLEDLRQKWELTEVKMGDLNFICPGIRPEGTDNYDQKRVATPARAREAGAFAAVVGRPILEADDPVEAARVIKEELSK